MISFHRITFLIGLVTYLPGIKSNPYTISDDRVRSLDITPVLGRGYSINTNSFQSTCLDVKDTTVPSYNYEYSFHEFIETKEESTNTTETTTTTTTKTVYTQSITKSFSYYYILRIRWSWWRGLSISYSRHRQTNYSVRSTRDQTSDTGVKTVVTRTNVNKNRHMVVSIMRIERYYSSVREEVSPLIADAVTLLDAQDYVGFFKACGPNYVRGIRRAQEVTGIFKFEAESIEKAQSVANSIRGDNVVASNSLETTEDRITTENKLEIEIIGYGLGLGVLGGTLVASNLDEYRAAMKFAFRAMTQGVDSHNIGQVYGIEVVPWVDNTAFQVASRLVEEVVAVPLPRSLIPKAVSLDPSDEFDNSDTIRLKFRCEDFTFVFDKYGNCCETNNLYNYTTRVYEDDNPSAKICRPLRRLDRSLLKNNMAANGEFVARLDGTVRYKLNQLATLQRCISGARAIPTRYDYNILKAKDSTSESDVDLSPLLSLLELKTAIDPFNDYTMVTHMAQELEEFMEMFYSPCLAALFGTNIGGNPNTDPSFFMAYPWHTHDECIHMSCFANGMRWDRDKGGCTPGMITGKDAPQYDPSNESSCAKNGDVSQASEVCKHNSTLLETFHSRATTCWENGLPSAKISYFIDTYCMPQIIEEKVNTNVELGISIGQTHCERTYTAGTKSEPFQIFHKQSSKRLQVAGAACTENAFVRLSSINRITPGSTFVYNYDSQTITRADCDDKPLTLDSCDASGRVRTETLDSAKRQTWIIKSDNTIESGNCVTDQYLATVDGTGSSGTQLGVSATKFTHDAIFRLEWAAETNLI